MVRLVALSVEPEARFLLAFFGGSEWARSIQNNITILFLAHLP